MDKFFKRLGFLWRRYDFAITHLLSLLSIAVAVFFAREIVRVVNNISVSATASVDVFKDAVEDDLGRVLTEVTSSGLATCEETWASGLYSLKVDGKAGYYPGLEYNVEYSPVALSVSKAVQRLLDRMEQLNRSFPSSLSAEVTTIGWADTALPRSSKTYFGTNTRCLVSHPNEAPSLLILNNLLDFNDNKTLACARAADFNRSAGIEAALGKGARLLGNVVEDDVRDGRSRGVTFEISIIGFAGTDTPLNLCPDIK